LIAGSLIKNLGGTIVPTGGYIAGKADLVDKACCRLTAPGIGSEGGITFDLNRTILQGLFLAPQMVSEALIGALYESLTSLDPIQNWLIPFWEDKSNEVLADPHRQNYKSALQELTQSKGLSNPTYKTTEIDKKHDNPKRFFCTVYIKDRSIAEGWGKSMKQAEKDAANKALNALDKNVIKL